MKWQILSHFIMKGKLRDDPAKLFPYYWITSLTILSETAKELNPPPPTAVLSKIETMLLSDPLQH
jgi:hypothetical protein